MAGPQPSRSLAKAVRVILDEAEYVGVTGSLRVQAKRAVRVTGDKREFADKIKLTIKGEEHPIRP